LAYKGIRGVLRRRKQKGKPFQGAGGKGVAAGLQIQGGGGGMQGDECLTLKARSPLGFCVFRCGSVRKVKVWFHTASGGFASTNREDMSGEKTALDRGGIL